MSPIKHAIVSAAGIGSRLGLNTPKCLVRVGGLRIIDYQLELLRDVEDVVPRAGNAQAARLQHRRSPVHALRSLCCMPVRM